MISRRKVRQLRSTRGRIRPPTPPVPKTEREVRHWLTVPELTDATRRDNTLVTIGMASIHAREAGMYAVLKQLLPQCDRLDLSLNGYPPGYNVALSSPKLNIFRNDDVVGPHGKLFNAHQTAGYFLTVDDDLIYPSNYVEHMVAGIDKYNKQAYVGYHGNLIADKQKPVGASKWCRCLFSHADELAHDMPVHMLGTGIFGYHSDAGRMDCRKLLCGKIDDQTATWAQDRRIPMVALAHPKDWVPEDKNLYLAGTPLRRNTSKSQAAIARMNKQTWNLYLPANWGHHHR